MKYNLLISPVSDLLIWKPLYAFSSKDASSVDVHDSILLFGSIVFGSIVFLILTNKLNLYFICWSLGNILNYGRHKLTPERSNPFPGKTNPTIKSWDISNFVSLEVLSSVLLLQHTIGQRSPLKTTITVMLALHTETQLHIFRKNVKINNMIHITPQKIKTSHSVYSHKTLATIMN